MSEEMKKRPIISDRTLDQWRMDVDDAEDQLEEFFSVWERYRYWEGNESKILPLDAGARITVERWLAIGLTVRDLTPMIERSMGSTHVEYDQKWKYLCGIVWTTIRQLQDGDKRNAS
jgi:hypothetical protein